MKFIINYTQGFALLLFSIWQMNAQTITPPAEVYMGEPARFTFSDPTNTYFPDGWECPDCELLLDESQARLAYMDAKWDTPGTHIIEIIYTYYDEYYGYWDNDYVTLYVNVLYVPAPTPPKPIVQSNTNGVVTLAWALGKTPPADVTWYWQSTSNGTSTANSNSTIGLTSDGTYYLRAYNATTTDWSDESSSISFTVAPPPTWYYDSDGDGFGDSSSTISSWTQPTNYVNNNLDFCPNDIGIYNGCPTENNENYIHTITYNEPYSESSNLNAVPVTHKIESINYYDGLGRPKQNIGIRAGGNSEDIITHIGYDAYGRQDKEYLPYALASGGGIYRSDALAVTKDYYGTAKYEEDFLGMTTSNINPYSEKNLEASPLSRILEQGAPGADWAVDKNSDSDKTIKFELATNSGTEVKKYEVALTASTTNNVITYIPTLTLDTSSSNNYGHYTEHGLYKTVTKDENWTSGTAHTAEEFKDKQGRVILKRTYGASDINMDGDTLDAGESNAPHDTYYVYDDYGNLTFVLPPKAEPNTALPDAAKLTGLCYQYRYDDKNRLVEKKIPGKDWEYIVYDNLDQPILTQDGNLRMLSPNKWLFTKYDAFGRVAYTGEMSRNISRPSLQAEVNWTPSQYVVKQTSPTTIDGTTIYYNNLAYPTGYITDILTINYYDNYTFDKDASLNLPSTSGGQAIINYNNASATQKLTKGLPTGSKVRVSNQWITTIIGYDSKGRVIYTASDNDYLSTLDVARNTLDFTGKVKKTETLHERDIEPVLVSVITEDVFTYDHMGRLKKQTQELNNTNVLEVIVENTYDDLGQLSSKGVGGKSTQGRLQTINYKYNVRGWLKQINDTKNLGNDLFGFTVNYNAATHGGTPLYNGNISETEWRTANEDSSIKWYKFDYDGLNRLKSAIDNINLFNLSAITYDKNGNITKLNRRGIKYSYGTVGGDEYYGDIDLLTYTYLPNSNRLDKVQDNAYSTIGFRDGANASLEYIYDSNGNMILDANKGITAISYNHLNLPTSISINGSGGTGTISYIYDANGIKQKKLANTSTTYAGNYVYEPYGPADDLKFFSHPEGYVDVDGGYKYVYQYKDHLGNIRLSYQDTGNYEEVYDSDFGSGLDGWEEKYCVNSIANGKLRADLNSINTWKGVKHNFSGFATTAGEVVNVKITFDKGNTQSDVRVVFQEIGSNGYGSFNIKTSDLKTGTFDFSHTMQYTGHSLRILVETFSGTASYFTLDDVSLTQLGLEIVEENNYYPFGIKHHGYNSNPTSSNIALKRKYNGIEYEDAPASAEMFSVP